VVIKAKSVGHPLMKNAVCNDFELKETNRLTLITGSNMSGKSTFLRTTGCNILLAYAGAPVFAKQFELTDQIQLFAYMRIKDSLQENASTFKAEIDRIRLLLDAMKNEPKALILVDEMLRGTNSEDKLKGSIAFLEEVIAANAFAMVATHDLRTTEMTTKYPNSVNNFYFEYDSKDGELSFDYQLKEGVCKSFNASELLRSVGLKV
jgi:DNA mismatch repair ATPase MutS